VRRRPQDFRVSTPLTLLVIHQLSGRGTSGWGNPRRAG